MNESWRPWIFIGMLFILWLAEYALPRREPKFDASGRRLHNLLLAFLNTALVRFLVPISLTAWADYVHDRDWGLCGQLPLSELGQGIIAFLILDLMIYLQHVAFHAVPWLWRLHAVHHADLDFDVTTGIRFHTIEIVLSQLLKLVAITLLGPPALAVLLFEIVLNAAAMFNHSNVALPRSVDSLLRWLLVTPDMHRVHHSIETDEMHRNFGFNFPWWDWLFRTYRAQPRGGHGEMLIGLPKQQDSHQTQPLHRMLLLPFARKPHPQTRNEAGESTHLIDPPA